MARKTVTAEDCDAAKDRLENVSGADDLSIYQDDGKFRLMTTDKGKPKPLFEKALAPSNFVQCCNFTSDILEHLGSEESE